EATRALEQTHLDSLIEDFATVAEASPMRRLGLVPARGLKQPGWLTHMFLHFGWMHLLGNMCFFYLVGPLLEDLWGRGFFGAFYLAGGMMAALAHFGIDPRSTVVMAGASGAIAACMGAFSYRCRSRRIRMAYMIGWIRRGTFLIPAWLWGGFWFAGEVFTLVSHSSEGVAVMAHRRVSLRIRGRHSRRQERVRSACAGARRAGEDHLDAASLHRTGPGSARPRRSARRRRGLPDGIARAPARSGGGDRPGAHRAGSCPCDSAPAESRGEGRAGPGMDHGARARLGVQSRSAAGQAC